MDKPTGPGAVDSIVWALMVFAALALIVFFVPGRWLAAWAGLLGVFGVFLWLGRKRG